MAEDWESVGSNLDPIRKHRNTHIISDKTG